jgi:HAD superfamily hydrolase (TIGR01509 family)
MPVRGVIFDMGGTLLHFNAPNSTWEDTEKTGARSAYRLLAERGYALPPEAEALDIAWDHTFGMWTTLGQQDVKTLKLNHQIRLLTARWHVADLPESLVEQLGNAYMQAIEPNVRPLDGAEETLRGLRARGLKLGLVSNTVWPGRDHRRELDRWDLTRYLDHLIFSSDAEAWKPYADVFQMSLDALHLQPGEAVFVGDSLYFDVWGAQQAGLRGVWIEQPHAWLPDGLEATPDATIRRLPDLLAVLDTWD